MLDAFPDPLDPGVTLMVMPYLRPCNNPAFGNIGEVSDFIDQTLEVGYVPLQLNLCLLCARAYLFFTGTSSLIGKLQSAFV